MFSLNSTSSQSLMTDCLNRLQKVRNKIQSICYSKQLTAQICEAMKDLKMHLQTLRINKQVFTDMQAQLLKHQRYKQKVSSKYKSVLQTLEMLIYQQDYQDLKLRINQYKADMLDQSIIPMTPKQYSSIQSEISRLDDGFILQNSQVEDNQFLSCIKQPEQDLRLKHALDIIYSCSPFQKKQQVWLQAVYSKNQDQSDLNHVSQRQVFSIKKNHKEITQFQMSLSEQNQISNKNKNDLQLFSGKKIKSMILLKEKSSKKKSKPKTSVKKNLESQNKYQQNAENQNIRPNKKLQFPKRLNESSQKDKKRMQKQLKIKPTKSFRKTLISHL